MQITVEISDDIIESIRGDWAEVRFLMLIPAGTKGQDGIVIDSQRISPHVPNMSNQDASLSQLVFSDLGERDKLPFVRFLVDKESHV